MYLYLLLLIFSIFIPLILSFDKKVRFYKIWGSLFPAIFIVGAVFITADIFFVKMGIWGFNPAYHSRIIFLGLPVEEWLFFIVIPYSSVFIHYVFISYYPDLTLSDTFVRIFTSILIVLILAIMLMNYDRAYTLFSFMLVLVTMLLAILDKSRLLNSFFFSFLIILVPFFIVNGVLTGSFITGEVVWYNNSEIIGLRILTVPVEDVGYAFSLILLNLLLTNRFRRINIRRKLK
jgi:lycopene cyclase domain-containing protein